MPTSAEYRILSMCFAENENEILDVRLVEYRIVRARFIRRLDVFLHLSPLIVLASSLDRGLNIRLSVHALRTRR